MIALEICPAPGGSPRLRLVPRREALAPAPPVCSSAAASRPCIPRRRPLLPLLRLRAREQDAPRPLPSPSSAALARSRPVPAGKTPFPPPDRRTGHLPRRSAPIPASSATGSTSARRGRGRVDRALPLQATTGAR
ncbi:hypothetical protein VPH35_020594 [Triticum aestivum]